MKKYKPTLAILAVISGLSFAGCTGTTNNSVSEESSIYSTVFSENTAAAFSSSELIESSIPEPPYYPGEITITATTLDGYTINYTIDEEAACAYGAATYSAGYIPDSSLSSSILTASAQHGTCYFGEIQTTTACDLTKNQSVLVKDESGDEKEYSIVTERTEGKLPMVYITLDNDKLSSDIMRYQTIGMTISIDVSKSPEYEQGLQTVHGKIRGRGNSTWNWDKKPYKIKLDEKSEVLGLSADKDWVLISNYADKSLMRNTLAYEMGKVLDFVWTPTQYPVDLFINGEYQGVYLLGEHMEVSENRVCITEKTDESEQFGYIIEVGGADTDTMEKGIDYFHTNSGMLKFITFKEPEADELTGEQRQEIIELFNKADNAIVNGGDISEYIDIDSFVDWVIIQELTNNTDSAFRRSCYFTVDADKKIRMGPIWDFDLAFGNYTIDNPYYDTWTIIGSDDEDAYIKTSWGNYLMQNEQFRQKLSERWTQVRDELLDTAFSTINYYSKQIYPSQEENFKVWQIWGTRTGYSSWSNNAANTYDLQIWYLKNFLTKRAAWINENIDLPIVSDADNEEDFQTSEDNSDISDIDIPPSTSEPPSTSDEGSYCENTSSPLSETSGLSSDNSSEIATS